MPLDQCAVRRKCGALRLQPVVADQTAPVCLVAGFSLLFPILDFLSVFRGKGCAGADGIAGTSMNNEATYGGDVMKDQVRLEEFVTACYESAIWVVDL